MLEDYLKKIGEHDNLHPIQDEEFQEWKENKVTKRFFSDFKCAILVQMDDVGERKNHEEIVIQATEFKTARDSYDYFATEWNPTGGEG